MSHRRDVPAKREGLIVNKSRRTPRPSLYGEIADIIRDRIVEGILPAGSFVDEPALAEELDVSRTPVREALKVLAFEGLIDLYPNQGSYVTEITAEDARQLIELLAQLEGFAGELACHRASKPRIALQGSFARGDGETIESKRRHVRGGAPRCHPLSHCFTNTCRMLEAMTRTRRHYPNAVGGRVKVQDKACVRGDGVKAWC